MSLLDRAARFIDDVLLLPEDVRETIEDAEQALEDGMPEEAELLLREVLVERPSLLRARQGLAMALAATDDVAGARAVLAVSRQLDPDEPEVTLLSARLALQDGDVAAAVEESREAARRLARDGGPAFAEACLVHARAERTRGRPDRAARELKKAIAAEPDDESLRIELAEALAEAGKGARAAAAVRGIDPTSIQPETAARLGLALHAAGEDGRARGLLERAATAGLADASRALAEIHLAANDLTAAELHARTAVARGGAAKALATLAHVLYSADRPAEAAQALSTASEALGGDVELLRSAARLMPLDRGSELSHLADQLEALSPGDEVALAARAWAEIAGGRAASLAESVGAARHEPRLALAGAKLALLRGQPQEALHRLSMGWVFAANDHAQVRALRRDALRALWRGEGQVDLAAAIDEVARFAQERGLTDAHRRAKALRDEIDRPLLLAILGEFNAGKSTLVNAFLGADVAPTGILPTTATLNLLRGGAEKIVRVVRKDGTTREGDHSQLKGLLTDPDRDEATIDRVEIVLPSELLERVWILDTPGSNAPVPEHEALAAEALRRADAALWIFDSGQAGKATEGKVLEAIRASRRHVVGALNKVDRLAEGQLEQIRASLHKELPELGDDVVALSAKRALKARLAGDDEAFVESGFPALLDRLETDVFNRSRYLKHRACGGRLLALLEDALGTEQDAAAAHASRVDTLTSAAEPLHAAGRRLPDAVDEVLLRFEDDQGRAFEAAAHEVLAFVRPRTNRFAKHGADFEDRSFLAEVIEQRLSAAIRASEARLLERLKQRLETPVSAFLSGAQLERRIRVAISSPMARFAGYQSGLLAGGALLRFFEDDLPRAELEVAPLAEALAATRAHPSESLRPGLQDAMVDLLDGLQQERLAAIRVSESERERLRDQVYEPLRALVDVVEELVE